MSNLVRVAATQFAVTNDVAANLQTCLRMIDEAARHQPALIVLPEFCNHQAWYDSREHSYAVAVPLGGDFLNAIAAKAAEHRCYIKVNVTLQREAGKVTGANVLFDPMGACAGVTDKQTLMGNENNFLERATTHGPIVESNAGRIGMYCCADGLLNETARMLAVRGAEVLVNSLNSFAECEASLHIPARAAENRVFVIAANKVGPLVPPAVIEPLSKKIGVPADRLCGAGESQIVAPDGRVIAKAPKTGEAVVVADIDPTEAANKLRPDGTDVMAARRPELYRPIAAPPAARQYKAGAASIEAAVLQPSSHVVPKIMEAVREAASTGVSLIVLPELCFWENGLVNDPQETASRSIVTISAICKALAGSEAYVATSFVKATPNGFAHVGALINRDGVVLNQPQLHRSARHAAWCNSLGDALNTVDLPWGRVALIVGDDALYPETFRLAALQDVEVVAAPIQLAERWEMEFGLLERAAENRLSLVAATRPIAALGEFGTSAVITVGADFTLWTEWKTRPFDGVISYPIITRAPQASGLTRATIYPANAGNRMVSQQTDLVDGRPWWLCEVLTA